MKNRLFLRSATWVLLGLLNAALGAAQSGSGTLPPGAWVHEGDSDGDGLSDAFETAHGLDPSKASSFADGIPDENRRDVEGRTMWELQEAEKASAPASAMSGSGACGATGLEVLLSLLLIRGLRRRTESLA